MTHATELQLSMHADSALPAGEAVAVAEHIALCPACQARLVAVRGEVRFIAAAMLGDAPQDSNDHAIPGFSRPSGLRGFALANVGTGLVIWLAQFLWKTLFGDLVVNATTWATSVYLPDVYALTTAATLYLLEEGMTMFDAYLGFVVVTLLTTAILWVVLMYRKSRAAVGIALLMFVVGPLVFPAPANALDLRRDKELVSVPESETIDDTLLVAAETVLIEGIVTGDVVAVGRTIDVSGTIEGNLLTFAETVTVRGKVGGLVLGGASSYNLRGATVGGDLWMAGETVGVDDKSRVTRNATFAAKSTTVEGSVGKDLYAFGETVEVRGVVAEDLEVFGNRLRLLGEAQVGGNVRFHSDNEDGLYRADTVRVNGEVELLGMPEGLQDRSRYATVEFYLWQIARLIGALIVGLGFLWLVPGLRTLSIDAGGEALKTAGIGFLTLVSVPLMALLVAFTLVGLPLSLFTLGAWMLGLYLSKILVAAFIGRSLFTESDSLTKTLLVGITIVMIAVNLPFIGGIINLLLMIAGLGLLVQYLMAEIRARDSDEIAQI